MTRAGGAITGKVLAIAGISLLRLFRYRANIFFVVISPLLFVFVLGLLFGGAQPMRMGVVAGEGPLTDRLTGALAAENRVEVVHYDDTGAVRTDVARGILNGAVVIPPDYDQRLRDGDQVAVEWVGRQSDPNAAGLQTWVRSVVPQEAAVIRAARFGATGTGFEEALRRAGTTEVPGVEVVVTSSGEAQFPEGLNQFTPIAPSLLLLFIFLTSLTAALGLIEVRRLGVSSRMLATPTPVGAIVAGEALGRYAVALSQGVIVMLGSALLFRRGVGRPAGRGGGAAAVLRCG